MRALALSLLLGLLATAVSSQSARDFDGSDDDVSCGDQDALEGINNLTVGCWFFLDDDDSENAGIIAKTSTSGNPTWELRKVNTEALVFTIRDTSGSRNAVSSGSFSIGAWHLGVGTFDRSLSGDRVKVYLDGAQVGADNGSDNALETTAFPVIVGRRNSAEWDGKIAHCFAVPRTWTATEVVEAYRGNLALIQAAAGRGGGYISLMDPEATPTTYRGQGLFAGACTATNHPAVSSSGPPVFVPGGQ
jgi:hypothetical protein